ncbi:polysaccharide deacetylase family protein [Ideonella sp. YS5]|uniref:polysaccharide deacetylase family protein n=1 Tax=Ideonella sp. YS5 TaxID=3453714 RepID=UPI003F70171F
MTATASVAAADCGPAALGTSRVLTLPREGAAYGRAQHAPLPLRAGEVVLSFDDGPRPESTPLVLQALAQQCVRATFFMNGEPLLRSPDLARRVRDAGHTVAMHGFRHEHFASLPEADQLADLQAMQAAHLEVFGSPAPAYRFPFLEETPALLAALKTRALTVMSVDLGIEDWLPDPGPALLTERLLQRLAENDGRGLVLLHDAQDQTAAALPLMLKALKDRGYRVVHLQWSAPP